MSIEKRKSVLMAIKTLASLFRQTLTEELINIWHVKLADMTDDEIMYALDKVTDDPEMAFMPTPAQFKSFLVVDPTSTNFEATARGSWLRIMSALKRVGPYGNIDFGDPAISKFIVEKGGWLTLCSQTNEQLEWMEKDFIKAYKLYKQQNLTGPTLLEGAQGFKNVIDYSEEKETKHARIECN